MNTLFDSKVIKKWTSKNPNSVTKNEINLILNNKLNTVKNVAVINTSKSKDHKIVRCKVTLDLKREKENLFRMKKPNILSHKMSNEFTIRIQALTNGKQDEWKHRQLE